MKVLVKISIILLVCLFIPTSIFASGFNLKSIDGVNTDGKLYSQWYHTSLQPTFSGEAPGGSTIDIKIDDSDYSTTADESGNWTWTPPEALAAGDHSVTLTNNDSLIAFTLTLGEGNINWEEVGSGGEGDTLPTVGITFPTIALLVSGTAISGHFFKKFLLH